MLKRGLMTAAIAALLLPSPAAAWSTTLVPGVTYTRQVRVIGGGPVVLHILRTHKHGGLYKLRPVLSGGTVVGRQSLTAMQRNLSRQATVAGVNGDFFQFSSGRPSGIFLRDGVLTARPNARRSALGIAFDGSLVVSRLAFAGSWTVSGHAAHPLEEFNRPVMDPPGVALFTPAHGARTPRIPTAQEVVLAGFPAALPNGQLTGTVVAVRRGGRTTVPPGGAVLQARGVWRHVLAREAQLGSTVTVHFRVRNLPANVADAIGGGPVLVRNGRPVLRAGEAFRRAQLAPKHPRTAVGQSRNGRLIFLVADGRRRGSVGLTVTELARTMSRLGAVTAVGFDGGGSSTMAFDGVALNTPSDGGVRRVANGLLFYYYGVFAPRPSRSVVSPNGDGVGDSQQVAAKLVRASSVHVRLIRPDGMVRWRFRGPATAGWIRHNAAMRGMREGRWRWVADAVENATGRRSRMERSFVVNRTLGFLRLSKERMRVVRRRGGRLDTSVVLTRPSRLLVTVRRASGGLTRVLFRGNAAPGTRSWRWNGRDASRSVVRAGTFTVQVRATNALGTISLADSVRVVRVKRPLKAPR